MLGHSRQGNLLLPPSSGSRTHCLGRKGPTQSSTRLFTPFVTPRLPESLEGGRASITVLYAAWPLVQTSLNLRLHGPCCKDTVLLCYLQPPFCYQFLPPLISCLQPQPICPAFFPRCGQMNAIDLPSPAPTVPWEPLSK